MVTRHQDYIFALSCRKTQDCVHQFLFWKINDEYKDPTLTVDDDLTTMDKATACFKEFVFEEPFSVTDMRDHLPPAKLMREVIANEWVDEVLAPAVFNCVAANGWDGLKGIHVGFSFDRFSTENRKDTVKEKVITSAFFGVRLVYVKDGMVRVSHNPGVLLCDKSN